MTYQVVDDEGRSLDAHYEIDGRLLVFHSRGGTKGKGGRNTEYGQGLRLLLSRVLAADMYVEDAWVDSNNVQSLPLEDRRIIDSTKVPADVNEIFAALTKRMKEVGRSAIARGQGGNPTKRIKLLIGGNPSTSLSDILGGKRVSRDFRSEERLSADQLEKVRADHIYRAIQLLKNDSFKHPYGPSTDYDLLVYVPLETRRYLPLLRSRPKTTQS